MDRGIDHPRGPRSELPQCHGQRFVTDGGMETDLIFHHGVELPDFAAFPLVDRPDGPALLTRYYDGYAAIAEHAGAGLMLESPTWRASPDWGARLGYDTDALAAVNRTSIDLLHRLRERYAQRIGPVLVSGMVGPRADAYRPGEAMDPDSAAEYHAPQLRSFAQAGADLATALTLTDPGEAIGIVRAADAANLPVAISFTVETDGRLHGGAILKDTIAEVDAAAAPAYFLVNCAHPTHIARALHEPARWRERILGIRANASAKSHAELDEAPDLDEGDPAELADAQRALIQALPHLTIIGGCCGTDARHVARMWDVA
jgi:homocysteine S-methyltransferase